MRLLEESFETKPKAHHIECNTPSDKNGVLSLR